MFSIFLLRSSDFGLQPAREGFNKGSYLVPHPPIHRQLLLAIGQMLRQFRRVLETHMHHLRLAGEDWTIHIRLATHRHHIVKLHRPKLSRCLRMLARNVHPSLCHHLDRMGIHPVFLNPGRIRLDGVALERPRPPLRHLTAAGVARAEEEDS